MSGTLADLALALRIGLRDLRGAGRSFVVLLGALTLGVAIIAAVGILNQGVQTALERDARLLLGGDSSWSRPTRPCRPSTSRASCRRAERSARRSRLSTLASRGRRGPCRVSLKAVDDAYPLLGEVALDPPMPLAEALADRRRRGRASAVGPPRARASATACGSARPTIQITGRAACASRTGSAACSASGHACSSAEPRSMRPRCCCPAPWPATSTR